MASNEVGTDEIKRIHFDDECCSQNSEHGINSECIRLKAEEYLNSDDVKFCTDPKLKREKQKLEDLLKSYKKLIEKYESKLITEEEKLSEENRLRKIPEIYALLHPDLYKESREDEKKRLISQFSRRHFSHSNRVVPPICRTPVVSVNKKQEEKERFIKILSKCPAPFFNTFDEPFLPKKFKRPKHWSAPPAYPLNERELEKERLSKIFATSGIYLRKSLGKKAEIIGRSTAPEGVNFCRDLTKKRMVRAGEYSPLSSKQTNQPITAFGEPDERRKDPIIDRMREYRQQFRSASSNGTKADKALSTNDFLEDVDVIDGKLVEEDTDYSHKRRNSMSTQTDPSDINETDNSPRSVHSQQDNNYSNEHRNNNYKQLQQPVYYLSPREKLMSDLHGVSQCFPGVSPKHVSPRLEVQDVKQRQVAYAKALQEQIEEKKRLEEERKRKEKEEEELLEQRLRAQQEKLENQMSDEQKKREDWLAQRQSHEEVLRRKMLEMELEAQEMKKMDRKKKIETNNSPEVRREIFQSRPLPPPSTVSEPSHSIRPLRRIIPPRSVPSKYSQSHFKRSEGGAVEKKFNGIRMAPLLEADRQNILSTNGLSPSSLGTLNRIREDAKSFDRRRAEDLLKAPIDFRIDRPPSPPIPAVHTRGIINNNNTKVLEEKWKVPEAGKSLDRTQIGGGRDNILTQLGAFRRQLHQEHIKLEERLQKQQSP